LLCATVFAAYVTFTKIDIIGYRERYQWDTENGNQIFSHTWQTAVAPLAKPPKKTSSS
jgi:hypothetical protein